MLRKEVNANLSTCNTQRFMQMQRFKQIKENYKTAEIDLNQCSVHF